MPAEFLAQILQDGVLQMDGLDLGPAQQQMLIEYLVQLEHWNKAYNLTAVNDLEEMVTRHLLDSLSVVPFIEGGLLLDAGTGAGLPGVPLAVARPGLQVTLLDSSGKRVRFLNHVRRQLGLENVHPVQERLESFEPAQPFGTIISRAFSDLVTFALAARHLAAPPARLLAMKGRYPERELQDVPEWLHIDSIEKLTVPGLQEDRHLVIMSVIA